MKLSVSRLVAAFVCCLLASAQSFAQVTPVTARPNVNPDGSPNNDAVDYGQFNIAAGRGNGTALALPQPFESFGGIQGQIGERGDQYLLNRQCCQPNLGGGFTAN